MINALFSQPGYVTAKKMLDATVLRHEAIASNLAHIETPNYRRLDIAPTFSSELKQAIAANDPEKLSELQPALAVDPNALSASRNGNSVQLESELVQLNQNSIEHALETQLVSGALLKLRLAITGRAA
jgi:flagellar basal-body rod protein FlgB